MEHRANSDLRIMTYNLHGCVGTDRRYDPARIMKVIREVEPAIFGMQEVRGKTGLGSDILDVVKQEYPGYSVLFLKTLTDRRGDYGNALVSRYPVLRRIDVDLDDHAAKSAETTGRPEARRAIFAQLDTGGRSLWVLVTHLALRGRVRKKQARLLIEAIHRHTDLANDAVLCLGDFNEWRRPNAFLRYLDGVFSKHTARRTFPSRFPLLALDRIWMSRHITRHGIRSHKTPLSKKASDHLPLYMDFFI